LATGPRCGLIEVVNDAKSIDEIHKQSLKNSNGSTSLFEYFMHKHGESQPKKKKFNSVHKKQNIGEKFKRA
jgi:phosphatidylinositol kinase/protein kinase (PI-3  family)